MDLNCKRCLVRESADKSLSGRIEETIRAIPPGERTDGELYEKRLAECKSCEWLFTGICRKCGCFVEVRAARENDPCPDIPDRWSF